MPTRAEVYARFGATAEAAQWFEHELGDLLYVEKAFEHRLHETLDPEVQKRIFDDLHRDTMGVLLAKVKSRFKLDDEEIVRLTAALKARNLLAHGFFVFHGESMDSAAGRSEIIAMLDNFDMSLAEARTNLVHIAVKEDLRRR